MKKTDFLEFLKSKQACAGSQDWIKSLPVKNIGPKTWAKYLAEARPDWAVWLVQNIGGDNSVEYLRVRNAALAEYERVWEAAWVEYERAISPARAKYERAISPARAKYERIEGSARAEYERSRAPAWAEYKRVVADAVRKLLTFKAVSKEVDNFMKV